LSENINEKAGQEAEQQEQEEAAGTAGGTPPSESEAAPQAEAKVEQEKEKKEEKGKAGEQEEQKKEGREEKPKFKVERDYVVPLRKVYWLGRNRRAKRAVRVLREFVLRHTKAERVVLDGEVNEAIWARSIKKPPRRLAVHVGVTEDKKAYVYLQKKKSSA